LHKKKSIFRRPVKKDKGSKKGVRPLRRAKHDFPSGQFVGRGIQKGRTPKKTTGTRFIKFTKNEVRVYLVSFEISPGKGEN